jgi:hypothetical protein
MTEFAYHPEPDDAVRIACQKAGVQLVGPNDIVPVLIGQEIGVYVIGALACVWTIPMQAIGGYAISTDQATVTPPNPGIALQLNPHFTFMAFGGYVVSVVAQTPTGPQQGGFSFLVEPPGVAITGAFPGQPGFQPSAPGAPDGRIGLLQDMSVTAVVGNPSLTYQAAFCFVQIATPNRGFTAEGGMSYPCSANGLPLCDSTNPASPIYPFGPQGGQMVAVPPGQQATAVMVDSPWISTTPQNLGPANQISVPNEQFQATVMFRCTDPTAPKSAFIPVVSYQWGWSVSAKRLPDGWWIGNPIAGGYPAASPVWPFFPTWNNSVGGYLAWGQWGDGHDR